MSTPAKQSNDLVNYRERIGFTQNQVAALLGYRSTGLLSTLERGHRFPNLKTALKLAAIYRVPVDFLYSKLYVALRNDIRTKELALVPSGQHSPSPEKETNVHP
jgi:transcriptional regulator with XRE-family HTH domain